MTKFSAIITATILSFASFFPALAEEYKIGDLTITTPQARATPPGAPVSGGYLKITNSGDTEDRLVSVTTEISPMTQIHEMKVVEGIMRMRPMQDGIPIAAGDTVTLEPGGKHLMFMKLKKQLKEGETYKGTLQFEKAGAVEVTFNVRKTN